MTPKNGRMVACANCGQEFYVAAGMLESKKYCSNACYRDKNRRFWEKVQKTDGCWFWTGMLNDYGYGLLRIEGKDKQAHRVSYELARGAIPPGLLVCHTCDIRNCVNPDHLFLGTIADNNRDCMHKGRYAQGEAHSRARLTADEVHAIRARFAAGGVTKNGLAREYGVPKSAIQNIIKEKTWKSLL